MATRGKLISASCKRHDKRCLRAKFIGSRDARMSEKSLPVSGDNPSKVVHLPMQWINATSVRAKR